MQKVDFFVDISKTSRELYALHCNLEFSVTPQFPELIMEFAHGKSLVSNGLPQNKSCIPIGMVMCTHTHTHSVQTCNHDHASSKHTIILWELCQTKKQQA